MTKALKVWIGVIAGLLVAVVVLLIVLIVQGANADRAREEAECREKYSALVDVMACQDRID